MQLTNKKKKQVRSPQEILEIQQIFKILNLNQTEHDDFHYNNTKKKKEETPKRLPVPPCCFERSIKKKEKTKIITCGIKKKSDLDANSKHDLKNDIWSNNTKIDLLMFGFIRNYYTHIFPSDLYPLIFWHILQPPIFIEILISEKLSVTFDRNGAIKKFEVRGDLDICILDPSATQCVIDTNIDPNSKQFIKPRWRAHPRLDAAEWKNGILCLKSRKKKFRVGRSQQTTIAKWKFLLNEDSKVPIAIKFWPKQGSDDIIKNIIVKVEYQCHIPMENVIVTFPNPTDKEPNILSCDNGDITFHDDEFRWVLNHLDGDAQGSMECIIPGVELDDLWPVSVQFEMENMSYSQIHIKGIHHIDSKHKIEHVVKKKCVSEIVYD